MGINIDIYKEHDMTLKKNTQNMFYHDLSGHGLLALF